MTVIKQYNPGTSTWQTVMVGGTGPQGPPGEDGMEVGPNPPADTDILWADTGSTGVGDYITTFPWIDVKNYGAIGDGVADDTAAVNAAITAAPAGAAINFPAGHYKLTPTIVLPKPVSLVGVGSAVLESSVDGAMFSAAADDITISGLGFSMPSASSVAVLGTPTAHKNLMIRDCVTSNAGLLHFDSAGIAYAGVPNTGLWSDVSVVGNRCVATASGPAHRAAVELAYVYRARVAGNSMRNTTAGVGFQSGIQWWGGNADYSTDGEAGGTANPRKCGDLVITDNYVDGTAIGGIWGSMGQRITATGNVIRNAGDVGLDTEGSWDVTFSGNVTLDCVNGGIATFFGNRNVTIVGNTVTTTVEGQRLIRVANTADAPRNTNITVSGNTLRGIGVLGLVAIEPADAFLFVDNNCYNARFASTTNNGRAISVRGNHFTYDKAMAAAFTAIDISDVHFGSGVIIAGNVVRTVHPATAPITQPAGSIGIKLRWTEWNDDNTGAIESNHVYNMPIAIQVEEDSGNPGRLFWTSVRQNILGAGTFVRVDGAGSASTNIIILEGNRTGQLAPYPSAVPTTGKWDRGQIVYAASPAVGSPYAWICVTGGTPGTWASLGSPT